MEINESQLSQVSLPVTVAPEVEELRQEVSRLRAQLDREVQQFKSLAENSRLMAQISQELASSLEYEASLQSVAEMIVQSGQADYCVIDLPDLESLPEQEYLSLRPVAVAHKDPTRQELVFQVRQNYIFPAAEEYGAAHIISTRSVDFYPVITDEMMISTSVDAAHLALMRTLHPTSYIGVPLIARNRTVGVLGVVLCEGDRHFEARDLALFKEIAQRVALAVDNNRLYRTEQLLRNRAEKAVRLRDEFLSIAAHELKTPITSLRGHSQLVVRQFAKSGQIDPQRMSRALEVVIQQSDKLAGLVNQLLDVSRLEAGKMLLDCQMVDLNSLVSDVMAIAETTMAGENHTLELVKPVAPLLAWLDPLRFEQVVVNLVSNALKYSPEGGRVCLELGLVGSASDPIVRLSVTDQGIGVPEEHRPFVFERFYQVHSGTHLKGMGLGLYISRQIIGLHGGRLEAEFPAEGGSRFIISLPLRAAPPTRPD